jgi:hypothetical protein
MFCCINQSFKEDRLVFVPLAGPGADYPRGFNDYFVTRLTGTETLLASLTPEVKTPAVMREPCVAGGSDDEDADPEKVRKLLSCINADCDYKAWFEVCCVLRDVMNNRAGFDMFDTWSATGKKYDEDGAFTAWQSAKEKGAYTLGTLVKRARYESPEKYAELFPKGARGGGESDNGTPFDFFAHYRDVIMALLEAKRTYEVVKRAFERQYFHQRMSGDAYGCHRWDMGGERSVLTYDKTKLKAQNENVFY